MSITICVKCRHHVNAHPGGRAGPRPDAWFYQLCGHPDLERPLGIDPVSGNKEYMAQNSLGMTYFTDERHPYCRDVNDGLCRRFEV